MLEEYFPQLLILIGIINIAVIYFFRYQFQKTTTSLAEIIELNKLYHYDLEKLLENIQVVLPKLQLKDYGYEVYFQDQLIQSKHISNHFDKNILKETLCSGDYSVTLKVLPLRSIGEQQDKNTMVFNTLLLLIHEDLHMKMELINKSFDNISKFHTFILHDTKNISQFFQTLAYNIDQCKTSEEKEKLFQYLQKSIHLLNHKSIQILKLLEINSEKNFEDDKKTIYLYSFLKKLLQVYELETKIVGDGSVFHSEALLYIIFENIIKNIKDKKEQEPSLEYSLSIQTIPSGDKVKIVFEDNGSKIEHIQKVFEPFYSTKKSGLGIGMYKVKTLLKSINGSIQIHNEPNVTVTIILPSNIK